MITKLARYFKSPFVKTALPRVAIPVAVLLLLNIHPALADCGGFATGDMDTASKGFLNVISGTPFRIGAGIAIVGGLLMVLLDGGQLPQFGKWGITALVIVLGGLALVGFLVHGASCGSF